MSCPPPSLDTHSNAGATATPPRSSTAVFFALLAPRGSLCQRESLVRAGVPQTHSELCAVIGNNGVWRVASCSTNGNWFLYVQVMEHLFFFHRQHPLPEFSFTQQRPRLLSSSYWKLLVYRGGGRSVSPQTGRMLSFLVAFAESDRGCQAE